ncbi:hypothetical protein V6N13_136227 [Hibiscus sabdariffa]|uniref:Purple acid phosphatase C-terminal domain-containing protein n=1 Tax=Hibiscus sabdariffa TaxID=183260 RepID=A0ABR2DS93_9ROSI
MLSHDSALFHYNYWYAFREKCSYVFPMNFQHRFSNIRYNVSSGERYPVPDESAPIYITVGDGGNVEGLADILIEPQPDYSAFREPSYGHSTLEIMNRTHALYTWHRNDDGKKVPVESFVLHNQYWKSKVQKRKLGKQNLDVLGQIASK